MPRRAELPTVVPWVIVTALPALAFLAMRAHPAFDFHAHSPEGHFYIVSLVSLMSAVLGVFSAVAAARVGNIRVVLLATSFLSMGVLFSVHGLSTPGFIVDARYDLVTGFSSRLSILVATVFLAGSAVNWKQQWVERIRPFGVLLVMSWTAALAAFLWVVLSAPESIPPYLVSAALPRHGSFVLVLALASFTAWRYFNGYRRSGLPLYGAVTLGSVLILEAQLGMEYGHKYHGTWWMYHVMLVVAFAAINWAVFVEFARGRTPVGALHGLALSDPIEQIQAGYTDSIISLAKTLEARDGYTLGHGERVAALSLMIGEQLNLSADQLRGLYQGALLHDVGKIGIPDRVLHKPERLSDEEYSIIKEHPLRGDGILRAAFDGNIELMVVRHHHERFDGTGYPDGLMDDAIPLFARIAAVADVYDALRSTRAYRPAWTRERARQHVVEHSRTHFDPDCVRAFLGVVDVWEERFAADSAPYVERRPAA